MTGALTGAPDSQRGPTALTCSFDGPFPHRFRYFCEDFGCFRRSFCPRGPSARVAPKTPRGEGAPCPLPPPLVTSLTGSASLSVPQISEFCAILLPLRHNKVIKP